MEPSSDIKPEKIEFDNGPSNKKEIFSSNLEKYRNHASIVEIYKNLQSSFISMRFSSWAFKITSEEIKNIS